MLHPYAASVTDQHYTSEIPYNNRGIWGDGEEKQGGGV